MKKPILTLLLVYFLCVAVFSGCSKESTTANTQVKVGTWKTAQTIQPFFYQDFVQDSYNIEVLPFTNPGDQKTALLAGSLDMCGTTLVTAIIAASQGEPVVIVCGLCNKCSALVVRNDASIKNEADLKGKIIAYVPGTMHHILLLEVLKRNGLDPQKDVELRRIDFFDMGQALSQGAVDAFCSGEPYPSMAVVNGYGRILTYPYYGESIGAINAAMITTRDEIKDDPRLIQDLVTTHAKATEYLKANPNIWLDQAAGFGTDRKILDASANNMELFWDMDENYITNAENLARRMKELGVISQTPDMDTLFDLSFINKTREELQK